MWPKMVSGWSNNGRLKRNPHFDVEDSGSNTAELNSDIVKWLSSAGNATCSWQVYKLNHLWNPFGGKGTIERMSGYTQDKSPVHCWAQMLFTFIFKAKLSQIDLNDMQIQGLLRTGPQSKHRSFQDPLRTVPKLLPHLVACKNSFIKSQHQIKMHRESKAFTSWFKDLWRDGLPVW